MNRDGFRRKILDDPVNRQLGRVVSYETADWGRFEQIGPLMRTGPDGGVDARLALPRVGEHTVEVLTGLGLSPADVQDLLDAKVARQLAELAPRLARAGAGRARRDGGRLDAPPGRPAAAQGVATCLGMSRLLIATLRGLAAS